MILLGNCEIVCFDILYNYCRVNANVDVIVSAVDILHALGLAASGRSTDHNMVSSLKELDECFSHHFAKCAAAERFVASKELFDKLINAALALESAKV